MKTRTIKTLTLGAVLAAVVLAAAPQSAKAGFRISIGGLSFGDTDYSYRRSCRRDYDYGRYSRRHHRRHHRRHYHHRRHHRRYYDRDCYERRSVYYRSYYSRPDFVRYSRTVTRYCR